MDIKKLKELVAKTPDTPGVYRFQVGKDDIYIGKASSIKRRLVSYTKTTDSRIQKMIATAEKLVHIETESDIEALILESQLIKQQQPQFNIMLRDDKQYFFVAFTDDEYPRLYLTHQPQKVGAVSTSKKFRRMPVKEYIGPFTDGAALKSTLKYLRNIFPYCTCSQKHHNFCLNYHIGKCIGFCCLKGLPAQAGDQPAEQHEHYMKNIEAIRDILTGHRSSLVKELKKEMETAGKKHDFDAAIILRNKLERLERVFYNAKVIQNSEILKSYNSGLPALLKSKKPIIRIEGYDISNIQGNHATGSMVTFIQGEADKNFYRKFNIKTVRGSNDTAMLREILERRFNHPEWTFPDLILIDGGKGQVSSALAVLKDMGISIPLVGLSKDDRHMGHQLIIPGRKHPMPLTKLGLTDKNLLLAVDAEAHRFAINHYRFRHRKSFQK